MTTTTLTRSAIVNALCSEQHFTRKEAKAYTDLFFEEICHALESGEQVKLSGFGNFNVRDKAQRPGCNPRTGEAMSISPRRIAVFHASKQLCARINSEPMASAAEASDDVADDAE